MPSSNLENLVKTGHLKREPRDQAEFDGLVTFGSQLFGDAKNQQNSVEGRFTLAYEAAHAFSHAALRWHGYRSEKRYMVFQVLSFTLDIDQPVGRFLGNCHDSRNKTDYEGGSVITKGMTEELIKYVGILHTKVKALTPPCAIRATSAGIAAPRFPRFAAAMVCASRIVTTGRFR